MYCLKNLEELDISENPKIKLESKLISLLTLKNISLDEALRKFLPGDVLQQMIVMPVMPEISYLLMT